MPPAAMQPAWQTYAEELVMLGPGIALWEPAPLHNYTKLAIGDVGYISHGAFVLLFSAAMPLGDRVAGRDVPRGFVPLDPGAVNRWQPRSPGALRSARIDQKGGSLGAASDIPFIQAGTNLRFESSHRRGAILLTKFKTFREDVERDGAFKGYMKRNVKAWFDYAVELGHMVNLEDIILVTGYDMTLDFAMLAFSSNAREIEIEFKAGLPGVASASVSAWGTWSTTTSAVENWGPQQREPPSQNPRLLIGQENASGNDSQTDYNQCVFVRGFRMRRRAGLFPTVIKAAAGPHDLGSGHRFDEEGPLISSEGTEGSDNEPVSDTPSFVDPLDPIFRYIFENSSAYIAILHDLDLNILMKYTGTSTADDINTLVSMLSPDMIEIGPDGIACISENGNSASIMVNKFDENSILDESTSHPLASTSSPGLPGPSNMLDATHESNKDIVKPGVREFTKTSCDGCKEANISCQMIFPCKNCMSRGVVCSRSSPISSNLRSGKDVSAQYIENKSETLWNTSEPRPTWNLSTQSQEPDLPSGDTSTKRPSKGFVERASESLGSDKFTHGGPQSTVAQGSSEGDVYASDPRTSAQSQSEVPTREKTAFIRALDLARDATRLDSSGKDPEGAIRAYNDSIELLEELLRITDPREDVSSNASDDVDDVDMERGNFHAQIKHIHDTYLNRLKVLRAVHPAESDRKMLKAPERRSPVSKKAKRDV